MKKLLIRWALRQLKRVMRKKPDMTYAELAEYGVADVMVIVTGEKAIIL